MAGDGDQKPIAGDAAAGVATLPSDAQRAEAEAAIRRATEQALLLAGRTAREVQGACQRDAERPDLWVSVGDVSALPPDAYDAQRERGRRAAR
jgi:hypothetical protein